jgi:hypothetical protein
MKFEEIAAAASNMILALKVLWSAVAERVFERRHRFRITPEVGAFPLVSASQAR